MRRHLNPTSLVILAIATMAACSSKGTERPEAPGSTLWHSNTEASATGVPHSGAPKVQNPLPESVLSGDPCRDSLTPERIQQALGATPDGQPGNDPGLGPTCFWSNQKTGSTITVGYDIETGEGLSGNYANTKPKASSWTELTIQGLPAVASVTPAAGDPLEFCGISIGITDRLSVDVATRIGRSKKGEINPCDVAPQVAEFVVSTLREKAGV